jgi:hypothetical protein
MHVLGNYMLYIMCVMLSGHTSFVRTRRPVLVSGWEIYAEMGAHIIKHVRYSLRITGFLDFFHRPVF